MSLLEDIEQEVYDTLEKYHEYALQFNGTGLRDWQFKFDRASNRYGCCYYGEKLITLSNVICALNEREKTTQTILHEVAHAIAGKESGHDSLWKHIAKKIGYTGERCFGEEVMTPFVTRRRRRF